MMSRQTEMRALAELTTSRALHLPYVTIDDGKEEIVEVFLLANDGIVL